MRRTDRATSEKEATVLLNTAEYGVLSTANEEGVPYGVPLNFCVIDGCVYFHCALEGQKIDNITLNRNVSFCAVGKTTLLPETFGTLYESVIISGEVEEVFDLKKQAGLEGLLHKYSPEFVDRGIEYIDSLREKTRVFKINVKNITGKARTL